MRTFRANKSAYIASGLACAAFGVVFVALGFREPFHGGNSESSGFLFFGAVVLLLATYFLLLACRFKVIVTEERLVVDPTIGRSIAIPWREIYDIEEVLPGENWVLRIYVKGRKPITLPDYIDEVGELAQILFERVEKRVGPKHLK